MSNIPEDVNYFKVLKLQILRGGSGLKFFKNNKDDIDYDMVLQAVKINGIDLQYTQHDDLNNNYELVLTAIKNNIDAFLFASSQLKNEFKTAENLLKSSQIIDIRHQRKPIYPNTFFKFK